MPLQHKSNPDNILGQSPLTRMFHEFPWRDREDDRATGQPQGVEPEAHLKGTSQGPTAEDARKGGQIRGRSRAFIKHPGCGFCLAEKPLLQ
jgi:hypothetical protein